MPDDFGPCAVTIGNFDGVHAAHRQIMRRAVEAATRNGWKSAVLTFDPHPAKLLAPSRAPRLLTTLAQRCA
ncbi:MAG: bifunctional riboflavin kinase/FAD synthetase, partial [Bryobacteraceae bacterium]